MITKKYIGAGAYEVQGLGNEILFPIQSLIPGDEIKFERENDRLITAAVSHLPSLLGLFILNSDYAQTNVDHNQLTRAWAWEWHSDSVNNPQVDCKVILYFVSEDLTEETGNRICFRKKTENNEYTYDIKNNSLIVQRSDPHGVYQHKREPSRKPIKSRIILSMNCLGFDTFLKSVPDAI
tara:strand:- start:49679 stop:50218 length:540 start_codon:yes stop_codon:yes gene_type:complete